MPQFNGPRLFPYMPPGSYYVHCDGSIIFSKEVPEDLKQRCLKDYEEYKERKAKEPFDPMGYM